jgi:hypothetical protein
MTLTYRNRINAWIHFYPEGNGRAKPGHVLHHINPKLGLNNPKRYNKWIITDLIMISRKEHTSIHSKGGNNGLARKVLCITTGEIFNCVSDAIRKYKTTHIV